MLLFSSCFTNGQKATAKLHEPEIGLLRFIEFALDVITENHRCNQPIHMVLRIEPESGGRRAHKARGKRKRGTQQVGIGRVASEEHGCVPRLEGATLRWLIPVLVINANLASTRRLHPVRSAQRGILKAP